MKIKIIFCLLLLILLCGMLCGCTATETLSVTSEALTISFITDEDVPSFVSSPTIKKLQTKDIAVFKSTDTDGEWEVFEKEGTTEMQYKTSDCTYLWGHFYVDVELMEFMDHQAAQKYLDDQGIEETVAGVHGFVSESYPPALWIQTEKDHYFVTLNENIPDDFDVDGYVYRFRTHQQAMEIFSPRVGTLTINDHTYPIEFTGINAKLSLVTILDEIADQVVWETETKAKVTCADQEYVLDLDQVTFKNEQNDDLLRIGAGGYPYICRKGKDIIIGDGTADLMCRELGWALERNRQNYAVNIVKTGD